jgi:hypothetical protein
LLAPLLTQTQDATRVAPAALLTDALRQACYGIILGLAYPVLRARHRPDAASQVSERVSLTA